MSYNNNDGTGLIAGIGCAILAGWLTFWGMVLYGLYYLVFVLMPTWGGN